MSDSSTAQCSETRHQSLETYFPCPGCGYTKGRWTAMTRCLRAFSVASRSEMFVRSLAISRDTNLFPIVGTLYFGWNDSNAGVISNSIQFAILQNLQNSISQLTDLLIRSRSDAADVEAADPTRSIWAEVTASTLSLLAEMYPDNPALVAAASMNEMRDHLGDATKPVTRILSESLERMHGEEPAGG